MRFQYSAHFVLKEMQESRRAYRHLQYESKETETGMREVCMMPYACFVSVDHRNSCMIVHVWRQLLSNWLHFY